jgi:hypothetical protein
MTMEVVGYVRCAKRKIPCAFERRFLVEMLTKLFNPGLQPNARRVF